MFFFILFLLLLVLTIAGMIYLVRRFHRFSFIEKISAKNKKLSWILSCTPIAAIAVMIAINYFSGIVCAIHLIVFWGVCDFAAFAIRKITKKSFSHNFEGAAAVLLTIGYLGAGWYFAHHIYETSYTLETQKEIGADSLRIVQIADSHLGVTLDGGEFAAQVEKIQQTSPDVVLITGDFVDDDSDKADMVRACQALGELETTYGVYFSFGNHDKGYFQSSRDFSEQELRDELERNNVIILEDETVLINDSFYLIGRQDRSVEERMEIGRLTENLDKSKYMIVLDHQPNDYDNETAAKVDLVLSGHTHGGHIFPAGFIGILMGANDKVYGTEHREDTDFVVTSGISGWAIPFKTGTISEYVVIDIVNGAS